MASMLDIEDFNIDEQNELESEELEQIPRAERKLRTQPYDKSVIDLVEMIKRGEICLRPNFQRMAVWDNKRASLLIESIWLNIPIPQIFVSVEDDGKWNVIDGQQRLTTLYRYLNNEFKLRGLEVLPELNNKYYKDLDDKPKRLLHGGNIRIVAIHEDSHPDIKFDVFMRINQGAVQLNPQELRNCLYRGPLNDQLHELAGNKYFLDILNLTKPHNRFKDVELILRILAMFDASHENFSSYPSVMKKFLNNYMRNNRNADTYKRNEIYSLFNSNIEKVYNVFGKSAFKKWNPKEDSFDKNLNLSLMDCLMLAFEDYSLNSIINKKSKILEEYKKAFIENDDNKVFLQAITEGTSKKSKIIDRVDFMKKLMEKVML